jgi:CDP-diacylglycerol--glycerol-3-phosphate 3-phosphatidyltransferase
MASLIPGWLRRLNEAVLTPIVNRLVAAGASPDVITTVGTLVLVGSAVAFGFGIAQLGGGLLLLSGVLDMLDGRVARKSGGTTKFGAFYDSTLDRVGEAFLFGGITIYFVVGGVPDAWVIPAVAASLTALGAGLTVSYARARAEGLGLDCQVGVAQRAERILGLGVPTLFFGAGPNGFLLLGIVAVLALLAVITVVQRIVHVKKLTRVRKRSTQARWAAPSLADVSAADTSARERTHQ